LNSSLLMTGALPLAASHEILLLPQAQNSQNSKLL
jgi:hypothetical protein